MLYENQQIGNFNYLLGYYLGKNNFQLPFSINTYQQTPNHDKTVGDMFGNLGGKYFILEFKRSSEKYYSELLKENRVKLFARLSADSKLKLLSKKGHFLCHNIEAKSSKISTKEMENILIDYNFYPYADLHDMVAQHYLNPILTGMKEFTMNLAFEKTQDGQEKFGLNYEELEQYLNILKECAGKDDYETTGTVACFNTELGNMVSLKFESLYELQQTLNLDLGKYRELDNSREIDRNNKQLLSKNNLGLNR